MPVVGRLRYLEALPPDVSSLASRPGGGAGQLHGTVVLIHGFPLNARMWEPQLELAQHGWRVIVPQLRGFDGPAADPVAASVDDYAGDVIDLLDALHIEQAVIGGLSMGGYITFAVFRHAARYFRGMILADTRAQADTPEGVEGRQRMIQLVREKGAAAAADEMLPRLIGASTRALRPEVEQAVRGLILSNPPETIVGALMALMTRPDATPSLAAIHCPALVLVGDEDVITPPAASREIAGGIAGAELVVIPGAGHMSNMEQPAAFNRAVARFLDHRV
ncbi:MAG: alpha/beta fold hydrolase [Acidobacteriota bacterium]